MTDSSRSADDGALLSAWLSGDLAGADAAELERRLAAEPELAERLERVHATVVALRGLDAVEPPEGMGARLQQRMAQERREVPSLAAARARRAPRWQPIASAAAAVVLLVALVPVVLRSAGGGGDSTAEFAVEDSGGAGGAEAPRAVGEEAAEGEAAEGEAPAASSEAAADTLTALPGPVVTEIGELPEAAVRQRAAGAGEAAALVGLPVAEGRRLAVDYARQLRAAEPLPSGIDPAACLTAVRQGLAVAVPVRVESFTAGGQPRLGYVLVTASEGSEVLDTVEVRVVDPATC